MPGRAASLFPVCKARSRTRLRCTRRICGGFVPPYGPVRMTPLRSLSPIVVCLWTALLLGREADVWRAGRDREREMVLSRAAPCDRGALAGCGSRGGLWAGPFRAREYPEHDGLHALHYGAAGCSDTAAVCEPSSCLKALTPQNLTLSACRPKPNKRVTKGNKGSWSAMI